MSDNLMLPGFEGYAPVSAPLHVRDLVLKGDELARSGAAKPDWDYSLAVADGPDFALRRVRGSQSELMAVVVTQGQYYVRNEKTGRIRPLTASALRSWLDAAKLDDAPAPWLLTGQRPAYYTDLMDCLADDSVRELVKRGMVRFDRWNRRFTVSAVRKRAADFLAIGRWKSLWRAAQGLWGHEGAVEHLRFYVVYACASAESRVLDYVIRAAPSLDALDDSRFHEVLPWACGLNDVSWAAYGLDALGKIASGGAEVDLDRLGKSLESASASIGITWYPRLLDEQQAAWGEIRVPYPRDFRELRRRLDRDLELARAERFRAAFERRTEQTADWAYADGEYIIRTPRDSSELMDEGNAMSNCVGSFAQAHAAGDTTILFMRRADAPEAPLVDVEVYKGQVRQAFRAHNMHLTDAELSWLTRWCERVGIDRNLDNWGVRGVA